MLKVDNLKARYDRSEILHDVSFGCDFGEVVCLLGRNGTGKTTTLKSVMGLLPSHQGTIALDGAIIGDLEPYAIARLGVGYVPEERLIFPSLSVAENLAMGLWRSNSALNRSATDRVLGYFPRLRDKINSRGSTLSGGEQQMLAIGRALVAKPKLLLVDEPTEGLAPVIVQSLEGTLRDLAADGMAVLIAESKLAVARRISKRIYVIAKGETVFSGSPADLERNHEVRRQYLEV
jgi:branched-chain amino acid transport system ATP-binding protein